MNESESPSESDADTDAIETLLPSKICLLPMAERMGDAFWGTETCGVLPPPPPPPQEARDRKKNKGIIRVNIFLHHLQRFMLTLKLCSSHLEDQL